MHMRLVAISILAYLAYICVCVWWPSVICCLSEIESILEYLHVATGHQYSIACLKYLGVFCMSRPSVLIYSIACLKYLGVFCISAARPSLFCCLSETESILEYFACLLRGPPSAGICLVRSASCRLVEAGAADTRQENAGQLLQVRATLCLHRVIIMLKL